MSKKADQAGDRSEDLEKSLLQIARKMGQSETTREKTTKREDALKIKLGQLKKQLIEAESRALHMEEEQHKVEALLDQMNEEKAILINMAAKKHP